MKERYKGWLEVNYENGTLEFIEDNESFVMKVINLGELDRGMNGIIIDHMVGIASIKQVSDS
jgi:hypothetical protein